jgi:cell division transport system ATP-binding protein
MIKFQNVSKIYPGRRSLNDGEITALENVSFQVEPKEFISIVGRSGAGKTTILKLILVEEKPTRGQIFFEGKNTLEVKSGSLPLLRRKIGAIFQDYKLFPSKTIFENIAYVLEVMGATDREIRYNVSQVLDIVSLKERANNFPAELSGGERQRAAVARALIHRPEVILADEPTGNLDPYHTQDIIQLLCKIHEMGTTVILATHNKETINSLGERVITLEEGRIIRDEEKGRFIL